MTTILPGDKHLTGSALIITEELPKRILLVHHKKFNVWLQPGGHVERDENPLAAAVRETKEETGIDISFLLKQVKSIGETSILPLPDFFLEEPILAHGDEPAHFHLDSLYIARVPMQKVAKQERESHDIGWFTLTEALALDIYENTRMVLKQILA